MNFFFLIERAVFKLMPHERKLQLTEIAPGMDIERDILNQMEFVPLISPALKLMDSRLFLEQEMSVKDEWLGKSLVWLSFNVFHGTSALNNFTE
jgi:propionate CoA-transferase